MGAYGACVLYVISLVQVRSVFYPVVCATIPPLLARGDTAGLNAFLRRQTRWVAILAMPLTVLFAGFGDGLLALFGPAFIRGVHALAILSLGYLTSSLALPAYTLYLSGNAHWSAVAGVTCVVIQCVLLPILVPRYGLTGAAISSATGLAVSQAMQLWFTWRLARVNGFSLGLLKVTVAASTGFLVGRALFRWLPVGLVARFFAGVGAAAVVYVVVLVTLKLTPEERIMVRDFLARVRGWLHRRPAGA